MSVSEPIRISYLVHCDSDHIRARAEALLLEQTVELPLNAVRDPAVARYIVGQVEHIEPVADHRFRVVIAQPLAAAAGDPAQLLNLLFGNSSLQPDLVLEDVVLPDEALTFLSGPRYGIAGLRALSGVNGRPLLATALKPMGLAPEALADLARQFALGGLDLVKDDHGLADHAVCPFERRVEACLAAVEAVHQETGHRTLYVPNLIGTPERVRDQLRFARSAGAPAVMLSPMLLGLPSLAELATHAQLPILTHPALAGVLRAAEAALLGTLFRWYGADAVIFPHAGGRFSYSLETCGGIARALRTPHVQLKPALPVPAGGIHLDRVAELVAFYGMDCMLLIGGSLYEAGDRLAEATRALVEGIARVADQEEAR
jgi:ribulose-bisphosphate carboxylase large chain